MRSGYAISSVPRPGFTLVELLIVVLILGILAAVVVPQVGGSSQDTHESALVGNLKHFRQAIELYRAQHNGNHPSVTAMDIVRQLTEKTDENGDAGTEYGPYLRAIPTNPVNGKSNISIRVLPAPPNNVSGWYYDRFTGEVRANSSGTAPTGTDYVDL